ncbi:DUF3540 domain-containing protein [Paraburkholderia sacchari]|uniref:DUF3540 domain-containing protein n=1 Tax=Paraburkholderia sacchari TaxID=159450 RepID=UPI001BD01993|nr:DUF3540 domain-containing protein [Paraburkholderia sacchari]
MNSKLVSLPRTGHEHALGFVHATVTGRADRWFFLNAADASAPRALRAQSCLIEPECGDTVLVCRADTPGANVTAYIVAVLACATSGSAELVLPGGVALHACDGALEVEAGQIALKAKHRVAVQASAIEMEGLQGEMTFHRLNASIGETQARLGAVTTIARQLTTTVGRFVQKARDSFRWTENVDETRAGRMRMKVEERLHVTARDASVLAEGHVKIDGEKIDLG